MKFDNDHIRREQFEKIFNENNKSLYYFAYNLVRREDVAEDLVAEAFIKLWKIDAWTDPVGYLKTVIRTRAFSHFKSEARRRLGHKSIFFTSKESAEPEYYKDIIEIIRRVVEEMPEARKKIIMLILGEDISTEYVAAFLGISVDTVRVQKSRAINDLRTALSKFIEPIRKRKIAQKEYSRLKNNRRNQQLKYT